MCSHCACGLNKVIFSWGMVRIFFHKSLKLWKFGIHWIHYKTCICCSNDAYIHCFCQKFESQGNMVRHISKSLPAAPCAKLKQLPLHDKFIVSIFHEFELTFSNLYYKMITLPNLKRYFWLIWWQYHWIKLMTQMLQYPGCTWHEYSRATPELHSGQNLLQWFQLCTARIRRKR